MISNETSNGVIRELIIDEPLFQMAFGRDVDFHDDYPQTAYLELDTGNIYWLYEEDHDAEMWAGITQEENQATRALIATSPDRYLEIPGLSHGDHHEILQDFLDSDWTEDENIKRIARNAYFGSIGKWKRSVDDESIVNAFYNFRDYRTKQMAEEFLLEHGITPQWA